MARGIDPDGLGLIHAEALSFALAAHLPRPEAQDRVKALCAEARETGTPLPELARRDHAAALAADLFTPRAGLGTAPDDARAFAAAVRAR
jgi:3-carboxy-cis,cis-muconate cycloisomerase